ncbi:MAG: hypothetical protein JWQ27_1429 [Ferruginibacter sp.]|nr:hypothetical protein [Ferruginibacter sp.]
MKKVVFAFLPWLFSAFSYKAMAQVTPPAEKDKKESQEIIIRKKGTKDATLTLQITGDKVLINGKPLVEFKDDEITINKKKIIIKDGKSLNIDGMNFNMDFDGEGLTGMFAPAGKQTFLGVSTAKTDDGVKIFEVVKNSPAEKAGLKIDDIITKIGDQQIDSPEELSEVIQGQKANNEVKISYKRDGKEKSLKTKLEERDNMRSFSIRTPEGGIKAYSFPKTPAMPRTMVPGVWNNDVEALSMYGGWNKSRLGLKIQDTEEGSGVKILSVEDSSNAATAGLKADDVITEISGKKVTNTDEAREAFQENREKASYPVKIKRNGSEMNLTIKIPKKLKTANL